MKAGGAGREREEVVSFRELRSPSGGLTEDLDLHRAARTFPAQVVRGTGEVGVRLEGDRVDLPNGRRDVLYQVVSQHPPDGVGWRPAGIIHVAGQGQGLLLHNPRRRVREGGLARRIWKSEIRFRERNAAGRASPGRPGNSQ